VVVPYVYVRSRCYVVGCCVTFTLRLLFTLRLPTFAVVVVVTFYVVVVVTVVGLRCSRLRILRSHVWLIVVTGCCV